MNVASTIAGRQVPAIQLIWSDENGCFPWDPGFNAVLLPMPPPLHLPPPRRMSAKLRADHRPGIDWRRATSARKSHANSWADPSPKQANWRLFFRIRQFRESTGFDFRF